MEKYKLANFTIILCNTVFILTMLYSLMTGQWSTLFIVGQALLITNVPYGLASWYDIHTPKGMHAAIASFMFGSLVLGEITNFYNTIWWWDMALHFVAGFILTVIALIMLSVVYEQSHLSLTPFLTAMFAMSFAIAASALWEVYEFTIDSFMDTKMQPSLNDTMWDIIVAIVAALLAALNGWNFLRRRRAKSNDPVEKIIREGVEKNSV